ncbi:O-antigen ligase family protein [Candidatus Woesebacteria bacterium]|nr:O-antigen ligase family protein [Candidatus Woesebacteria bacterium]
MKQILLWILMVLIFLVPSNLFLKFSIDTAYVRGIFVDYLVPKIYLSEALAALFLVLYFCWQPIKLKTKTFGISLIFITVLAVEQYYLRTLGNSFFYLIQITVTLLMGITFYTDPTLYTNKHIKYAVIVTVLFQSVLGLFQFFTQHALYGYLFLGEPDITHHSDIVREQLLGAERILPYGTTAHPNILGGCIALYLLLSILYWLKEKNNTNIFSYLFYSGIVLGGACLWATQSTSAMLTLISGLMIIGLQRIYKYPTIHVLTFFILCSAVLLSTPLILRALPHTKSPSVTRRIFLNSAATTMIAAHPLTGVGLLSFTRQLESIAPSTEIVRFIQPVHTVLLLWLAETGVIGAVAVLFLLWALGRHTNRLPVLWLALLPIMALDHYFLTIQTGMFLLVVYLALSQQPMLEKEMV